MLGIKPGPLERAASVLDELGISPAPEQTLLFAWVLSSQKIGAVFVGWLVWFGFGFGVFSC